MARKKGNVEFRYYEIPQGEPVLALYGDAWIRTYGYDEKDQPILDLHFHNLLEIGLCIYGDGEIILEETAFPYQAGTLTVIPKNYPHTTNAANHQPNKWEYLFLNIDKLLAEFYPDNRWLSERLAYRIRKCACCTTVQEHPTLALLVRQVLKEMQVREEFYRETTMGLLRALVVEMARLNPELIEESGRAEKNRRADTLQITRALEYVGDHYDREIKIGDLAQLCHLSETHFRRIFARCMGVHPIDYVNQVRIRNACQLLKKTNDSIMEISIKCGFGSSAAFNRNFRKFMGVTPNEWRKLPENYERRLTKNNISYYDGW